jgi:hypothetical protein
MHSNRRWLRTALLSGAAVAIVVLTVWFTRDRGSQGAGEKGPTARSSIKRQDSRAKDLSAQLHSAAASLQNANDAEASKRTFSELRAKLYGMPREEASAVIVEFLNSNADAATGLELKLGPGGSMAEPPSLRVFLEDYLAHIDPTAAATYAEKVLGTMNSPEEWAISLRNYALANTSEEARAFLRQKMEAMMRHEPWQKNASTAFLEAFDVAVYLGGTELMPTLTDLLRRKDNQAVAHAAYLAVDRLVLRDPVGVLNELYKQPELMKGREPTRANFFARANLDDPRQRALIESYLLSPQLPSGELEAFAAIFPNLNLMISHNLLTQQPTPGKDALIQQGKATLQVVEGWLGDPRFARLRPQLEVIKVRLVEFVPRPRLE